MKNKSALLRPLPHSLPRAQRVIPAIALVTCREILRDKILYNVGVFGILLIGIAFLAARLSFIRPERILIDFGIAGMNLTFTLTAVLLGAQALLREQERHTIWVALSHPIRRGHFVAGKFFGVVAVLTLNWALTSTLLFAALATQVNEWSELFRPTLIIGLFLLLFQSCLFVALAFFLTSFLTFSMTVMIAAGVFLIGNSLGHLRVLAEQLKGEPLGRILDVFTSIHPDLERFSLGFKITYDLPLGFAFVAVSVIYAAFWIAALLTLASILLERREG